jgi:hypothetical protein
MVTLLGQLEVMDRMPKKANLAIWVKSNCAEKSLSRAPPSSAQTRRDVATS